jgi:hypothetical protein
LAPDDVSTFGADAKPNAIGNIVRCKIISDLILPTMSASNRGILDAGGISKRLLSFYPSRALKKDTSVQKSNR